MKHYQLRSRQDDTILYEGHFACFRSCLEQAITNRIALNCVDLRNKNLSNANLDDGILPGADFTNSNLSGANMSEAYMKGATFNNTALYNTCLCDSNLTACNFESASFGATDIHGSIISNAQFSTLSCFSLDFTGARAMSGCIFVNPDGQICQMSRPPIVIKGVGTTPIILMDKHVKQGHNLIDHKRLRPLAEKLSSHVIRQRISA